MGIFYFVPIGIAYAAKGKAVVKAKINSAFVRKGKRNKNLVAGFIARSACGGGRAACPYFGKKGDNPVNIRAFGKSDAFSFGGNDDFIVFSAGDKCVAAFSIVKEHNQ